jgi:hypothetical protein
MRTQFLAFFALCAGALSLSAQEQTTAPPPPVSVEIPTPPPLGPKIQFADPIYDFGKVKAGDPVKYTYYFTNVGDQTLELKGVQPSCGCTTAGDWSKTVDPGQIGKVPIQFNSANYNGPVLKTITVTSTAKDQPSTVLQLKGTIWKPIEYLPPYTVLTIPPDAPNASATVRIVNHMDDPLEVWQPECNNASFAIDLKTNTPGKEYSITISGTPPFNPGSIAAKITLKSSSTNSPVMELPFWANIQPSLMVMPQQIMLPAPPLAARTTPSITIQNNTTNHLSLSDPTLNIMGVEVQVKELQPGRIFNVGLVFPVGFEIPAGVKAELTLKSSDSHMPLITVPVTQMPKTASVPVPTTPVAAPGKAFSAPVQAKDTAQVSH